MTEMTVFFTASFCDCGARSEFKCKAEALQLRHQPAKQEQLKAHDTGGYHSVLRTTIYADVAKYTGTRTHRNDSCVKKLFNTWL